jgi:hypothetical protein
LDCMSNGGSAGHTQGWVQHPSHGMPVNRPSVGELPLLLETVKRKSRKAPIKVVVTPTDPH